jgi:hypothetical protein
MHHGRVSSQALSNFLLRKSSNESLTNEKALTVRYKGDWLSQVAVAQRRSTAQISLCMLAATRIRPLVWHRPQRRDPCLCKQNPGVTQHLVTNEHNTGTLRFVAHIHARTSKYILRDFAYCIDFDVSLLKDTIFWDVAPSSLIKIYRHLLLPSSERHRCDYGKHHTYKTRRSRLLRELGHIITTRL